MFTRTALLLCVGCRLVAGLPADAGNGISDRFFLPFINKVFEDKVQVLRCFAPEQRKSCSKLNKTSS